MSRWVALAVFSITRSWKRTRKITLPVFTGMALAIAGCGQQESASKNVSGYAAAGKLRDIKPRSPETPRDVPVDTRNMRPDFSNPTGPASFVPRTQTPTGFVARPAAPAPSVPSTPNAPPTPRPAGPRAKPTFAMPTRTTPAQPKPALEAPRPVGEARGSVEPSKPQEVNDLLGIEEFEQENFDMPSNVLTPTDRASPVDRSVAGPGGRPGKKPKEETVSRLNTEADKWDGGGSFQTVEKDAWGNSLYWKVTEGKVFRELKVGSSGPDGLPKNSDDLEVSREKTVFTIKGDAKAAASGTVEGAISGAVEGAKGAKDSLRKKEDSQKSPAEDGKK